MHTYQTNRDLQRELLATGVSVDSSTDRRRFIEAMKYERKPIEKQLLTPAMKEKRLNWARKYHSWTAQDWEKVSFSDKKHFLCKGFDGNLSGEARKSSPGNNILFKQISTLRNRCFEVILLLEDLAA
ncbi:hypothetical protein TNCV_306491 [Trichonephila clavipes]|nr:hypothetical protein TNCV_306491 [Trichonephila clavipes]